MNSNDVDITIEYGNCKLTDGIRISNGTDEEHFQARHECCSL